MNRIQEWLFSHYAEPYLRSRESFNPAWLQTLLQELPLSEEERLVLFDKIAGRQLDCSEEAFALGMYVGLQLCADGPDFLCLPYD